jgi:hypothetical protein
MSATVKVSGPLSTTAASTAVRNGLMAVRKSVAREGANRAAEALAGAVRGGTGHAEKAVTYTDHSVVMISGKYTMPVVVPDPATDIVVTTSLASYGPWLEGTGSRNYTTRFKGYRSFAYAAAQMNYFAESMADQAMEPFIARMQ